MKAFNHIILGLAVVMLAGCNDYIDVMPKGKQIPETLEDFTILLNNEYTVHFSPMANALYLLNDMQVNRNLLSADDLRRANFMWDESADRVALNLADESAYYNNYAAISSCNLVIEHAPTATECTEAERATSIAYAKVIRAQCYYQLVNFYADQYVEATADKTPGVPLITSADVDAPYTQVSVGDLYRFIVNDVEEALTNGLPDQARNILLPDKAAAYALLSRIYLSMSNYQKALENAQKALAVKDELFDWNQFYDSYAETIENPEDFSSLPTPMNYSFVENYNFRCGDRGPNYTTSDLNIPELRGPRFEAGDAKFLSRWKLRTVGENTYYQGILSGFHNYQGLTVTEVRLNEIECLARLGEVDRAMDRLNELRTKRIRPDQYRPLTAANRDEALRLIADTRANELIFSIVSFADAKRYNATGGPLRTFTKEWDGQTYTLAPDSHLWTMVFPKGAVKNPGNGSITQNSK